MNRLKLLAASIAFVGIAQGAQPESAGFELALVDMQGQKKVLGTVSATAFAPRVSPDGQRVAFEQKDPPAGPGEPELTRIYVAPLTDLEKRKGLQVTVIARQNIAPVWSPEGDRIAFLATGNGADALFFQRSDGGLQPIHLVDGRAVEGWYDGKITFLTLKGNGDYGISEFDLQASKATPLIDLPGSQQHSARISPDGKWIAYASDETGRQEVWLEPLPRTGKRFQLTKQGGRHPQWSPEGTRIYFDDQDNRLYRMDVTLGAEARAGEPVALPITGFQQGPLRRQYDLTPDGKGFVMLFPLRAAR